MNPATPVQSPPADAEQPVIRVPVPGYEIQISTGLLDHVGDITRTVAPAHRYAIITDDTVGPLYAARVAAQFTDERISTVTIPAGEVHKNRDTWAAVTDQLLASGLGRDSAIIALGGGVVGDLAGFVAATFMRGIPFVQVPTTLLAMIDASIGGKTGVDTPSGKNLVGAFHPPAAVIVDPLALDTLPVGHLRAGLAEAVKHGVIADAEYFGFLGSHAATLLASDPAQRDPDVTRRIIARSVEIKASVVARDLREAGIRKILNFGHTIGHAIELLSGFSLSHGEAVAIGMVLESRAGELSGITESGTTARIIEVLDTLGLPSRRPVSGGKPSPDAILPVMSGDKKSRGGAVEYAIPSRVGEMAGADRGFGITLGEGEIRHVLAEEIEI